MDKSAGSMGADAARGPLQSGGAQALEAAMFLRNHAVEVVAMRLDVAPMVRPDLIELLDDAERARVARLVFERDQHRFIVGRARLRQLLAERLRALPEAIEFAYGGRGKPALGPRHAGSDLRFNVSHCDDLAVYAFAHGREIGVDVEAIREMRDADDIAARFFASGEVAAYRTLDPRDRPAGFFNCWTRKEAFIKALGDGLHYELDRFEVSLDPDQPARILRVEDVPGDACGWCIDSFSPAPGFVGAVVVATAERCAELRAQRTD